MFGLSPHLQPRHLQVTLLLVRLAQILKKIPLTLTVFGPSSTPGLADRANARFKTAPYHWLAPLSPFRYISHPPTTQYYSCLPRTMESIQSSETLAYILRTLGKFQKEYLLHSEHGESLKTTIIRIILGCKSTESCRNLRNYKS